MKHFILLFSFFLIVFVQVQAGEKKSKYEKTMENWFKKADLNYQKTYNGYKLWYFNEPTNTPIVLSDTIYNLYEFLFHEAYVEIYRYPHQEYSPCELLKGGEESVIGSVYSKTENQEDIIYMLYEVPYELSSTSLYSVVAYMQDYCEKLRLIIIENHNIFVHIDDNN